MPVGVKMGERPEAAVTAQAGCEAVGDETAATSFKADGGRETKADNFKPTTKL
jgi:hypothetical protein